MLPLSKQTSANNTPSSPVIQGTGIEGKKGKKSAWEKVIHPVKTLRHSFASLSETRPCRFIAKHASLSHIRMGTNLVTVGRYIANAGKKLAGIPDRQYVWGPARLTAGIDFPIVAYQTACAFQRIITGTVNEKIDEVLSITSNIGTLGSKASSFSNGLQSVGFVALKSIFWATPLFLVGVGLECAGIVLTTKELVETAILSSKFSKKAEVDKSVEEYRLEDYQRGVEYLEKRRTKERSFVGKFFKTDSDNLSDQLLRIEIVAEKKLSSSDPVEQKQGKSLLYRTVTILKSRLLTRIPSCAIGITAGIVATIGAVLLFSPIPPLGFALLALAIVLTFAKIGYDYGMNRHFVKQLSLDPPPSLSRFPLFPSETKKRKKESLPFKLKPFPSAPMAKIKHYYTIDQFSYLLVD